LFIKRLNKEELLGRAVNTALIARSLLYGLRNLQRRKVRTSLTVLAVVLATALTVSIFLLSLSMRIEIERSLDELLGDGMFVRGKGTFGAALPEEIGLILERIPHVESVMPVVFIKAYYLDEPLLVIGTELEKRRGFKVIEGKIPDAPDEALLSEKMARYLKLQVGNEIRLTSAGRLRIFRVVGIAEPDWLITILSESWRLEGRIVGLTVRAAQEAARASRRR